MPQAGENDLNLGKKIALTRPEVSKNLFSRHGGSRSISFEILRRTSKKGEPRRVEACRPSLKGGSRKASIKVLTMSGRAVHRRQLRRISNIRPVHCGVT